MQHTNRTDATMAKQYDRRENHPNIFARILYIAHIIARVARHKSRHKHLLNKIENLYSKLTLARFFEGWACMATDMRHPSQEIKSLTYHVNTD